MMKYGLSRYLVVIALVFGLAAGCGESGGVKTVDVSGTVTLDGKPLEGVGVRFVHGLDHTGVGVTGPGGTFKLGNGAVPGENKVYFTVVEGVDDEDEDEDLPDAGEVGGDVDDDSGTSQPGPGGGIPAKYRDPATTEMTFTVPEGGTTSANLELTSQ